MHLEGKGGGERNVGVRDFRRVLTAEGKLPARLSWSRTMALLISWAGEL